MVAINPRFVTDREGNRTDVVLTLREYEALIEELEMAEDVRLYDEAKAEGGTPIPWEQVKAELDQLHGETEE